MEGSVIGLVFGQERVQVRTDHLIRVSFHVTLSNIDQIWHLIEVDVIGISYQYRPYMFSRGRKETKLHLFSRQLPHWWRAVSCCWWVKCETVQSSFKLCVVFLHLSLVSTPQPPLPWSISTTQSALLFNLWGHRHAVLIHAPALAAPLASRRPALHQHNKHMNLFMQLETRTTCLQKSFQRFPVISPKLTCFFLKKPRLSQLGM